MSLSAVSFLLGLLIVSFVSLLLLGRKAGQDRKTLDACSELLQDIFKMMGEPSTVTRILSQETPDQELTRLKYLLEKKVHAALLENTALKFILSGLPDGLIAVDAARNVLFCNREYCELAALPVETHEGKKLFEILRYHIALTEAEKFLNKTQNNFFETELLTGAGKTLRMRIVRLQQESSLTAIFVFSDISDLKKLETMRRDFVANVSHELRTPLTSIHGFIETLLDGAGEEAVTRKKFLNLMKTDSERLRRLIEDLLTLSRVESQTRDFEKRPLNAEAEIHAVLELFELRLRQKKLILKKQTEPNLTLTANQDQFRQVLINLLDNAVKFTPEDGVISISAASSTNEQIEIRVADSGPGIHPDNHEKVFQRFFREDKARSRETGGTGLGLAIVKHIMEAHRGRARCEAAPDKRGSVFILSFPSN